VGGLFLGPPSHACVVITDPVATAPLAADTVEFVTPTSLIGAISDQHRDLHVKLPVLRIDATGLYEDRGDACPISAHSDAAVLD
jgi:hypothetical protein